MIKTDVHFKSGDVVGKKTRKMLGVDGYVPRERLPNEALPNQINKMESTYVPKNMEPVRPGADDHKRHKSRGF